jgi:thioredoxin-like negative regulator of GroEL
MPVDQGIEQARQQNKPLLVVFEASWSPPCKRMHEQTWSDPRIKQKLAEVYVAVVRQSDVDGRADANTYRARVTPTLMVFKDGQPFDKITGYQSADEVLKWLEEVEQGKRRAEELLGAERAQQALAPVLVPAQNGPFNIPGAGTGTGAEHPQAAQALRAVAEAERDESGRLIEVWLIEELKGVADADPDALRWLESRRDQLAGDEAQRWLWVVLNDVVNDNARTFDWLAQLGEGDWALLPPEVKDRLMDMLVAHGRYADIARLFPEPGQMWAELERYRDRLMGDPELMKLGPVDAAVERARRLEQWADEAGVMSAALLASGREDEAAELMGKVTQQAGDQGALAIIEWALQAGQVRAEHNKRLQELLARTPDHAQAKSLLARGRVIEIEQRIATGDGDPQLLAEYLEAQLAAQAGNQANARHLRGSRVQQKLDAAFAAVQQQGGDEMTASLEAAMAYRSGRYGLARQRLDALGDDFDTSAWQRAGADPALARSEVYARTGPVADVLNAADRLVQRDNADAAIRQYRSALFILPVDDPARVYIESRIAELQTP